MVIKITTLLQNQATLPLSRLVPDYN